MAAELLEPTEAAISSHLTAMGVERPPFGMQHGPDVDAGGDELVRASHFGDIKIRIAQRGIAAEEMQDFEYPQHLGLRPSGVVHFGDFPRAPGIGETAGVSGSVQGGHRHGMRHDVIRVSVAPFFVVRDRDIRPMLPDETGQPSDRVLRIRIDKGMWRRIGVRPLHAGIVVAEHVEMGDTQDRSGLHQFVASHVCEARAVFGAL